MNKCDILLGRMLRAADVEVAMNFFSSISENVFNVISQELNVQGHICEILHKIFEYTNKIKKTFETEFDSQFTDYRETNEVERSK